MADDVSSHRCSFRWGVGNPFLPWRNVEAIFYHGSPTITRWIVTLQPMDRRINFWRFSFSLQFDNWFDQHFGILADRVQVIIQLDNNVITRSVYRNYHFNRANQYTLYIPMTADVWPQIEPHKIAVMIDITLRGTAAINRTRDGQYFVPGDLRWLSKNLRQLLGSSQYSNMTLVAKDSQRPIEAHSYIIDARWKNFRLHGANLNNVQTYISRGLLWDILVYMYSGKINPVVPNRATPSYITELFQVIDWYKIHHLYKVFAKDDARQLRFTENLVHIESRLVPLERTNEFSIKDSSQLWPLRHGPEYQFVFEMRVKNVHGARNRISYKLHSVSQSRVYFQVSLEVVKRVGAGNALQVVKAFHQQDSYIDPDETKEGKRVLYLHTYSDFGSNSSDGTRILYFIRWFVSLADGTRVCEVQNDGNETLQSESERFKILSDHMNEVKNVKKHTDMLIENSGHFGIRNDILKFAIHKGILAVRAPHYWEGLQGVPHGSPIPDDATILLSSEVILDFLDYMYRGKVFNVNMGFVLEVGEFAHRTRFIPLLELIRRVVSGMNPQVPPQDPPQDSSRSL